MRTADVNRFRQNLSPEQGWDLHQRDGCANEREDVRQSIAYKLNVEPALVDGAYVHCFLVIPRLGSPWFCSHCVELCNPPRGSR